MLVDLLLSKFVEVADPIKLPPQSALTCGVIHTKAATIAKILAKVSLFRVDNSIRIPIINKYQ